MDLPLPDKIVDMFGKIPPTPINSISELNIYRTYVSNDYGTLLSFHLPSDDYVRFWEDSNSYKLHYLDIGEKEDLSYVTEKQWKALEMLHKRFRQWETGSCGTIW
jgi:hypothetical protein